MDSISQLPWAPKATPPSAFRRAGRLAKWAARAPADRLTLPAAAALYATGEILNATGVPALDVAMIGGVALPAVTFGIVNHRSHRHQKKDHPDTDPLARAGKYAFGMMMAGAWAATAARWGVMAGPFDLSSVLYGTLTCVGYGALRYDEVTRGKRDWRNEKIRWQQVSKLYGLQGSHLLGTEKTRLGRVLTVDTTGTGRRASQIAGHDTAERIAEHLRLPAARVTTRTHAIAGRIRISIRARDPWAHPIPHPVLDTEPEITLPVSQSITDPLIVGQDPETGKPLEVVLYDEDGANGMLIVGLTGSGKTILLNCLMERLTACEDALVWDINLSKAKENRRWAPACDLTAHGPGAKRDALAILRLARKVIDYRGAAETDDAVHVPTRQDPAIILRVDEMDALQGAPDPMSQAIREELNYVNSKKRSEGVVLVEAGQRGTISHGGSADIRANFNTFAVAKVRGRSEIMHALGDLGMDVPDMTSYGEGHAGVWLLATLGGDYEIGRTFKLKELGDLSEIAQDRQPRATLPPALLEYLGDSYQRLKTGAVTAHKVADEPAPQPWMDDLAKELEGVSTDVFDQMDKLTRKNAETVRQLDELASEELIELGPEHAEALKAAIAERQRQAAATVEISDERLGKIRALLQGGPVSSYDIATALDVNRTTAWRYLGKLRIEGLADRTGTGRGARWHATGGWAA